MQSVAQRVMTEVSPAQSLPRDNAPTRLSGQRIGNIVFDHAAPEYFLNNTAVVLMP
jgi:hypothetical protein